MKNATMTGNQADVARRQRVREAVAEWEKVYPDHGKVFALVAERAMAADGTFDAPDVNRALKRSIDVSRRLNVDLPQAAAESAADNPASKSGSKSAPARTAVKPGYVVMPWNWRKAAAPAGKATEATTKAPAPKPATDPARLKALTETATFTEWCVARPDYRRSFTLLVDHALRRAPGLGEDGLEALLREGAEEFDRVSTERLLAPLCETPAREPTESPAAVAAFAG